MIQTNISKLWNQFHEKINSEWSEKYSEFGQIDKIKGQIKLCEAIRNDILAYQGGNVLGAPSKEALNMYFNQKGFGKKPKLKTLEAICDYLGYKSVQDFLDQNQSVEVIEEIIASESQSPRFNKNLLLLIPILIIPFLGYHFYTQNSYRDLQEQHFQSMIQNVNDLEFSLYKSIPKLDDTILLYDYYDTNYRDQLIERLIGLREKEYILDQDLSLFKLTADPEFISVSNSSAEIETAEYWKIVWRKDGDIVHEYDHVNKQLYAIEKMGDGWLIVDNVYEGEAQVKEE